jgi:outer membrane protein assembly factor BamB
MDSTKTGMRLGLVCCAIFVSAGFCFGQAVSSASRSGGRSTKHVLTDWNEFHKHDMTRFNRYEKFLTVNNVGNLGLKWSYAVDVADSSPAVLDGVVYIGLLNGSVYALDAHTGSKLWGYATGGHVTSSPAVANGVVYVGSFDDNVYALDASTGALLWSYATGNSVQSSPAVANGVVYVGSDDGNVYALNAQTGGELWSYTTVANVYSSPAVVNGVVYFGSDDLGYHDGRVYAFSLKHGRQ